MSKLGKIKISYERGRRVLLFLFCLFLAFFLWSIHKLSEVYSVNLSYRVHIVTQKRGHASEADAENLLSLKGRATGFYILQHRYGKKDELITLPVEGRLLTPVQDLPDKFYVLVSDVENIVMDIISDHVEKEDMSSDTLFFSLPSQSHRDLPIAADYNVRFKDQYMSEGKMKLSPSTVTVYGDKLLLEKTDSIYINHLNFDRLSESKSGVTGLVPVNGLRYSESEIYYELEVVRYIEKSLILTVEPVNVPENKMVRFYPVKVELTYRTSLKNARSLENAIFAATIDYNDITASISNTIEPKVTGITKDILSMELEPRFVKCKVIEK